MSINSSLPITMSSIDKEQRLTAIHKEHSENLSKLLAARESIEAKIKDCHDAYMKSITWVMGVPAPTESEQVQPLKRKAGRPPGAKNVKTLLKMGLNPPAKFDVKPSSPRQDQQPLKELESDSSDSESDLPDETTRYECSPIVMDGLHLISGKPATRWYKMIWHMCNNKLTRNYPQYLDGTKYAWLVRTTCKICDVVDEYDIAGANERLDDYAAGLCRSDLDYATDLYNEYL